MVVAGACSTESATTAVTDPSVRVAIEHAAETDAEITSPITDSVDAKVGCAAELLGRDRAHPAVYYAWLVCVGPPTQGNVSVPVRATLNGSSEVASLKIPRDNDYGGDVARLFPASLRDVIVQERGLKINALFQAARRAQSQR